MRKAVALTTGTGLLAVALITLACSSKPWDGEVRRTGTFEEVLRDRHTEGRVPLAGITDDAADEAQGDIVAVGALEGLRGEITIVDGDVWMSRAEDGELTTERGRGIGGNAAMLVSARVQNWSVHEIDHDIAPEELEDYVHAVAADAGLDAEKPFPFRIEGTLTALDAHVIAGDCPMRAQRMGEEPNPAPVRISEAELPGHVVGFYAEGREGDLTHHGSRMHAHLLSEQDQPMTAHIESVGVRAGGRLRLPAR